MAKGEVKTQISINVSTRDLLKKERLVKHESYDEVIIRVLSELQKLRGE